MRKIIFLFCVLFSIKSMATPPLLIRPNSATINITGTPTDTVVKVPRLVLVEYITYSGFDSTVTISFNGYVNLREYAARRAIKTNVPLEIPPFKNTGGVASTLTSLLQQARQYYIGLGYSATIIP